MSRSCQSRGVVGALKKLPKCPVMANKRRSRNPPREVNVVYDGGLDTPLVSHRSIPARQKDQARPAERHLRYSTRLNPTSCHHRRRGIIQRMAFTTRSMLPSSSLRGLPTTMGRRARPVSVYHRYPYRNVVRGPPVMVIPRYYNQDTTAHTQSSTEQSPGRFIRSFNPLHVYNGR